MGKRYRLVKIYPRSVKLGTIIEFGVGYGDTEEWIKQYPKEASEFWEELEEKEFSVMKHDHKGDIFSIRRKSDGIIFTIGDKVNNPKLQKPMPFIIAEFYFDCNNEQLLCNGEHCGNGHINITKIEHYKEPLFITEDKVSVFEGDSYFLVFDKDTNDKLQIDDNKRWSVTGPFIASKLGLNCSYSDKCKRFTIKDLADKYIEENKPLYSKKDVYEMFRRFDKDINNWEPINGDANAYDAYIKKSIGKNL